MPIRGDIVDYTQADGDVYPAIVVLTAPDGTVNLEVFGLPTSGPGSERRFAYGVKEGKGPGTFMVRGAQYRRTNICECDEDAVRRGHYESCPFAVPRI